MSCDSLASWRPRTRPTRGAQPRQSKRRGRRSCPSRPSSAAPSPGQGVPRRGFAVSRRFLMKHQAERDDRTTTSTAYLYLYTNSIASAWSVWTPWSATLPGLRSSSSCAPARPPRRALAAMDACGSHGRVRGVRSTSTPPQGKRNVAQSRLAPRSTQHVLRSTCTVFPKSTLHEKGLAAATRQPWRETSERIIAPVRCRTR